MKIQFLFSIAARSVAPVIKPSPPTKTLNDRKITVGTSIKVKKVQNREKYR